MRRLITLLFLLLLVGCAAATPEAQPEPTEAIAAAPDATATAVASATSAPTRTPAPTRTLAPSATPTPTGLSEAQLAELKPNELGWALVMEWHLIEPGENTDYNRTPDAFRADLAWLYANDFYPVRFRDLATGDLSMVPAGKSPVVLAFDDSSIGQYHLLDDGTVDPDSAMGILLAFAEEHPDFPPIGTFFVLLEVDVPERILFGQPEHVEEKLRTIVELGGEVGSHTVSHERLDSVDDERVQWQLATSQARIEELIGDDYEVVSLALPLGIYPANEALLREGESEGVTYRYLGAAEVGGGLTAAPHDAAFDPYHINRAQAIDGYIDRIRGNLEARPGLLYVSDGDPTAVTIPTEETLEPEHQGQFDEASLPEGVRLVRYDRPSD